MDILITHARCMDGLGAAWVAKKRFPNIEIYFSLHDQPPSPNFNGKNILITDFSYKRPVLLELKEKAKSLLVLDHHETAEKDLEGLDFCIFNKDKSGAGITWDYFFPDNYRPWIIKYIEDSDLWKWSLPYSKEVRAYLESYPKTIDSLDKIMDDGLDSAIVGGSTILRFKENIINEHIEGVPIEDFLGYEVPIINATVFQSEIGSILAINSPFSVSYYITKDGSYKYSLRSTPTGINVGELAAKNGGGGNPRTAGITSKTPLHQI